MSAVATKKREAVATGYQPPALTQPIDLDLSRNECRPVIDIASAISGEIDPSRYPCTASLEKAIAKRFGVDAAQVLVTAGGDDGIERVIRLALAAGEGDTVLTHDPTFEMISIYTNRAGGRTERIAWLDGPFPTEDFTASIGSDTALVALVTPNNPTGRSIPREDLFSVLEATDQQGVLVLVDLAYAEFTDNDPTDDLLRRPGVVVARTFSKAWGLAGLRVGYLLGQAETIARLRAIGAPFPVSSLSAQIASRALETAEQAMQSNVESVVATGDALTAALSDLGATPIESDANFVLARFDDAAWIRDALAGMGIKARAFPDQPTLANALRITCPPDADDRNRLLKALQTAMEPEALFFDMDGVLADVSRSYRQAIIETAGAFGVDLTPDDIKAAKRRGDANNDWYLTQRLLADRGVEQLIEQVIERFERIYQGNGETGGLKATEGPLVDRDVLLRLRERLPLGIVTGRPRADAEEFLDRFNLRDCFDTLVTMEDGPSKPDPTVLRVAMDRLNVSRAWYIGDTVDDVRASRGASLLPVGVRAPGEDEESDAALLAAGAARVLGNVTELEGLPQ